MHVMFIDPSTKQVIVAEATTARRIITSPVEFDNNGETLLKQPQDEGCVLVIELKKPMQKTIVFEFNDYGHAGEYNDELYDICSGFYNDNIYDMTDVPCRWFYNDKIDIAVFEHESDELYNDNPLFELRGIQNQNERLSAATLTRQHCDIITAALRASNASETGIYLIVVTYWQDGNPPDNKTVPGASYICEPYKDKMTLMSKN